MGKFKLASAETTSFSVACAFVDVYMPEAHPSYVSVYLYGLRQCHAIEPKCEFSECAKTLHMLESDVMRAWEYWESKGVVRLIHSEDPKADPGIEFLDIAASYEVEQQPQKPIYDMAQITGSIAQDPALKQMLEHTQGLLGKTLSRTDMEMLFAMYDCYRLPPGVILLCVEHCVDIGKKSMKYIDAVAQSWAEAGVTTMEKAASHVAAYDEKKKWKRQYKKLLGLSREITDAEYAYLVEWIKNEQFEDAWIVEARNVTEKAIGKISFKYMNAVLQGWKEDGVTDPRQAQEKPRAPKQTKQTPFSGISQRTDYDIDEIRRREFELNRRMAASSANSED